MITRMTVDNFKALRHVEVDLAPFTVLIGANDTGKTSFLESIYALAESTRNHLAHCFWSSWKDRELVYQRTLDTQVNFTAELSAVAKCLNGQPKPNERIVYSLAVDFVGGHECRVHEEKIAKHGEPLVELPRRKNSRESSVCARRNGLGYSAEIESLMQIASDSLQPAARARWDVEELAMPSRLPENRRYPFDPSGYGLATCIAEIKLGRTGLFDALRDEFCSRFPAFKDIIVQRATVYSVERNQHFQKQHGSSGEGYALTLLRKDGVEIPASLASGGVLVTLAFLTFIHLEEPRKFLLIEEPENALHPGRLKDVVPLLRQAVDTHNDCQVVVTTHSPLLLDHVDPSEVRLFLRNDVDDVEVYNVADVPDIRERLKYLMLGELIYNEGEKELVKEIREHASAHSGRGTD